MVNSNILKVRGLQKKFGEFYAIKDVDIEIKEGKIIGLLGKNGAGKTTLIKAILGLYKDFSGEILYQGKSIDTDDEKVMGTIGALVDTRFHEDLTAYDNLMLLLMASSIKGRTKRKEKIAEILELVGLENNAKDKVKSFSMGMKQRLALAQALMVEAKLLILDEPFVGLDPLGIELIKDRLRWLCEERGVSIIFSSHQLQEVSELSEYIIVINDGKISYQGTYESLVDSNKKYHIKLNKAVELTEEDKKVFQINVDESSIGVIIKKSDEILSKTLLSLLRKGLEIVDIEIEENALLQLFKD